MEMVDKVIALVKQYQTPIVIQHTDEVANLLYNSQNANYKGKTKLDLTGINFSVGTHLVDFFTNQYVLAVKIFPEKVDAVSVLQGINTEDDSEG